METNRPSIRIAQHAQTRVVLMHAKAIKSLNDFFNDMQYAFEIPSYFGHNLDALEETLSDLSWIKEPQSMLIIYRSELLLKQQPDDRQALFEVLNACSNPSLDILFL